MLYVDAIFTISWFWSVWSRFLDFVAVMASSSRPTAADDLHADSGIESTPEISQIEHNQNLEYEVRNPLRRPARIALHSDRPLTTTQSDGDSGYSASE